MYTYTLEALTGALTLAGGVADFGPLEDVPSGMGGLSGLSGLSGLTGVN